MDWFRSYHGAPMDAKLVTVAKRSETQPGVSCAVWWALLDYASQHSDRGSVKGFDCEFVADFFGWPAELIERVVQAMRDKGLLTGDRIASWERRQPEREDYSTNRVRRFRDRKAGRADEQETHVKRSETRGNARTDEMRTEEMREEGEEHAPSRSVLPSLGEMADFDETVSDLPALAGPPRPQPVRDRTDAELDRDRAVALAAERDRRKRAAAWAKDHPDEIAKIERAVDAELRLPPGPIRDEARKGAIVAEILSRINRPAPTARSMPRLQPAREPAAV